MTWPTEISGEDLAILVEQWHTRFPVFTESGLYLDVISYKRWELTLVPLKEIKRGRFNIYPNLIALYTDLDTIPPPILYIKESQLVLDGNHRVEIAASREQSEILAYVGDRSTYEYVPWPSKKQ